MVPAQIKRVTLRRQRAQMRRGSSPPEMPPPSLCIRLAFAVAYLTATPTNRFRVDEVRVMGR